jgi:molybdopterin-binding protein
MNVLTGVITGIITENELSLVKVSVGFLTLTSIVIDTPATSAYLTKGHPVKLLFKETEVIIARVQPLAISVQNKIECIIRKIRPGKILCQLDLEIVVSETMAGAGTGERREIRSIITRNACEQLNLTENERIIALIKTNEVSLSAND